MVVGILRLTLYLPENHSLKGKRQVLRAIKARVRTKFNVSIAESDNHDMWQRAPNSASVRLGGDRAFVDSALREVSQFYRFARARTARRRAPRNHRLLRNRGLPGVRPSEHRERSNGHRPRQIYKWEVL